MQNRKTNFIMLMLSSVLCFSAFKKADNQTSVKIGTQEWTSKNLDVTTFRNGDVIPEAKTAKAWVKAGEDGKPAWCYYNNKSKNGEKYGKLYNGHAVTDPRGLAPNGWHIPSHAEWTKLADYLGGKVAAGNKMKSEYGWEPFRNGSNESGFSGLPGGSRYFDGEFSDVAGWWDSGSTNCYEIYTTIQGLNYDEENVGRFSNYKYIGHSVRCIRD